jgi:hypothetical protein
MWALGALSLAFSLPQGFWEADSDDSESQIERGSEIQSKNRR